MSEPHVLLLNKAYPPWLGGIERHVADLGEGLVQRGWNVSALVASEGRFATRESLRGVLVHRMPSYGRVFSMPLVASLRTSVRRLKPDLVHVHVPNPMAWLAVRYLEGIPVVCTWHSDIIRQRWLSSLYGSTERAFLRRCDRIIATSGVLAHYSKPLHPWQAKCDVIPLCLPDHGIPHETIQRHVEAFRRKRSLPVVAFVGRLVGYKGLPVLLKAMKRVDAELWIAGDGPLRKKLKRMVEWMGLQRRVRFLGTVSEAEKIALYRLAHVTVLPSIQSNEAFGYVLLEALREGCPLISTDLPTGVRWVNQHERTGYVVPAGNVRELEDALRTVVRDQAVREHFTRQARQWYDETFSFPNAISSHERVYRQLVG